MSAENGENGRGASGSESLPSWPGVREERCAERYVLEIADLSDEYMGPVLWLVLLSTMMYLFALVLDVVAYVILGGVGGQRLADAWLPAPTSGGLFWGSFGLSVLFALPARRWFADLADSSSRVEISHEAISIVNGTRRKKARPKIAPGRANFAIAPAREGTVFFVCVWEGTGERARVGRLGDAQVSPVGPLTSAAVARRVMVRLEYVAAQFAMSGGAYRSGALPADQERGQRAREDASSHLAAVRPDHGDESHDGEHDHEPSITGGGRVATATPPKSMRASEMTLGRSILVTVVAALVVVGGVAVYRCNSEAPPVVRVAADRAPELDPGPAPRSRLAAWPATQIGAPMLGAASTRWGRPWVVGRRGVAAPGGGDEYAPLQDTGAGVDLLAVVVLDGAARRVVAVGKQGVTVRTDDGGRRWSSSASGVTADLLGITASDALGVFAVGKGGTILRDDGSGWREEESPTPETLHAVAADGEIVLAVGDEGTLVRRVAGTWSRIETPTREALRAIVVRGRENVLVGGDSGTLLAQDGPAWRRITIKTNENIRALSAYAGFVVAATGLGNVWTFEPKAADTHVRACDDTLIALVQDRTQLIAISASGASFPLQLALP
jgi:hypothetical protein